MRGHVHWFSNTLDDKDKLKYEHGRWSKHTKEYCWDLHGYLHKQPLHTFQCGISGRGRGGNWFKGNKPIKHNVASTSPISSGFDDSGLSQEEIEAF